MYYIVTNITEELIGRKHTVFTTEVDGMIAFLVNILNEDEAQAKQDLIDAAQEAQEVIQGNSISS